jgi:hypothetical protein
MSTTRLAEPIKKNLDYQTAFEYQEKLAILNNLISDNLGKPSSETWKWKLPRPENSELSVKWSLQEDNFKRYVFLLLSVDKPDGSKIVFRHIDLFDTELPQIAAKEILNIIRKTMPNRPENFIEIHRSIPQ